MRQSARKVISSQSVFIFRSIFSWAAFFSNSSGAGLDEVTVDADADADADASELATTSAAAFWISLFKIFSVCSRIASSNNVLK